MIKHLRYIKIGSVTTIEKEFSHNGKWWLPLDEDYKVNGTLLISPTKGIVLDLFTNFKSGFIKSGFTDYELINGETREGGRVTLYKCFEVVKKVPIGIGEIHQTFRCTTLLWGEQFKSKKEMSFFHFQLEFPYHNYFFIDHMFDLDHADKILTIKDSYEFKLTFNEFEILHSTYNMIEEGINTFTLKKHGHSIIRINEGITLEEFNSKILVPIQNYFGFLSDVYNWVLKLKASFESQDQNKFVEVIDSYQFPRSQIKEVQPILKFAKPDPNLFIITLKNWLKKYNELKIIIDLYSDVMYREGNSPTVQFILLVQACEHYHSLRFDNNIITDEKFKTNMDVVLNSIDKKHKKWVNDALRHSNKKTLKQRLKELFIEYDFIITEVLSDYDKTIKKIGDTRNYFTHYNKKLKNKIAIGEELNFLILLLLILLKVIVLKELGISQQQSLYAIKGQGIHRTAKEKSRELGYLK